MQTVSTALQNTIDQAILLKAKPRIVAEWNYNRFAVPTAAAIGTDPGDNSEILPPPPAPGAIIPDPSIFPAASVAQTLRPYSGLPKARVGKARTYSPKRGIQWRTAGAQTVYKYWESKGVTDGSGNISGVSFAVTYDRAVQANKLVATFERSSAVPTSVTAYITTDGTNWTQVGSGLTVDANGRITLYRQANGSYSSTVAYGTQTTMRGVRFDVLTMSASNQHVGIIDMSARLEVDISADIITCDVDKQLTSVSFTQPLGLVNSNVANITLDNSTGTYNTANASSLYYGILDQNVKLTLDLGLDSSQFGGPGIEYVRQGIFYADGWGSGTDYTVQFSATDHTKFFQTEKLPSVFYQNKTGWEVITQLLETIGFNNYAVVQAVNETDYKIPYVWFKQDTVLWDAIQAICTATQSVFYIDEFGTAQWRSRDSLFSSFVPSRQLNAVKVGSTQADIIDLTHVFDVQANKVTVRYQPVQPSQDALGKPITSALWTAPDPTAVISALITKDISATDTTINFDETKAAALPYSGLLNIEGEIISYASKTYKYYKGGVATYGQVASLADQQALDLQSDAWSRSSNKYVGQLYNCVRGLMGSVKTAHTISLAGWTSIWCHGASWNSAAGVMKQDNSQLQLWGPGYPGRPIDMYLAVNGTYTDQYQAYGTRVLLSARGIKQQTGGLFFNLQSDNLSGYFVEISSSQYAAAEGHHHEIRMFRRYADGSWKALPNAASEGGIAKTVARDVWYDIEVLYDPTSGNIKVYVDGQLASGFNDPYATPLTRGKWGVYARGNSVAAFEYFYAIAHPASTTPDQTTIMDKVRGDYISGWVDKNVFYGWAYNAKQKRDLLVPYWTFTEFGPYMHEVRRFDVDFDKFPALNSFIYLSNDMKATVPQYYGTAFDAHFYVANTIRSSNAAGVAILAGQDDNFIVGQSVTQALMIYGQVAEAQPEKTVVVSNQAAINRQGEVALELNSPWVQDDATAKAIGQWITQHWGTTLDTITVNVIPHIGLQLGDVVSVNFPAKNMTPANNIYHVVDIKFGFDGQGLTGNLTLRRMLV